MKLRRLSAITLGLCLVSLWSAPFAHGVPAEPVQSLSYQVPLAGPLLFSFDCAYVGSCELDIAASKVVPQGKLQPIAGTFEIIEGEQQLFVVFRPEVPLVDGENYATTLTLDDGLMLQSYVAASKDFAWPTATEPAWNFRTVTSVSEPSICCSDGDSGAGGQRCYGEQLRSLAELSVSPAALASPYVFALSWSEPGKPERTLPFARSTRARFEVAASEFCGSVQAKSLVDGSIQTFSHCAPAEAGVEYGVFHETTLAEFERLHLDSCPPPSDELNPCASGDADCVRRVASLQRLWCDAHAGQFAMWTFCGELVENDASSDSPNNAGAHKDGGIGASPSNDRGDGGLCALTHDRRSSSSVLVWLLVPAGLASRMRRRLRTRFT